jgi:hypothetical protein
VLDVVLWIGLFLVDAAEDLLARPGDDTLVASVAYDGVGLTRACLAIGKETSVIAIEGIIEHFLTLFLIKIRNSQDRLREITYQILKNLVLISIFGIWYRSCVTVDHFKTVVTPVAVVESELFLLSSFL